MNEQGKIPRVDLPADARLDTLAVREGLPPTAWGENSDRSRLALQSATETST